MIYGHLKGGAVPLFGSKEPLDPRIESVWAKPQHHKDVKQMESALRKAQESILDEAPLELNPLFMVAVTWQRTMGSNGVFALTEHYALHVKKNRIESRLDVSEIAEVELGQSTQGIHVTIWTRTALTEFLPDDLDRWKHGMLLIFPTPGIATGVADRVKLHSPLLNGSRGEESN
jgi:hypothetical protein